MAVGQAQVQTVKACGICLTQGHAINMCPMLQEEDTTQQANAIGGFPRQPQRKYNPYSNTYNPSWRDHPNFRYGNNSAPNWHQQQYQPRPPQQIEAPKSGMSFDDIVKALATNTQQFQKETRASIQNLES